MQDRSAKTACDSDTTKVQNSECRKKLLTAKFVKKSCKVRKERKENLADFPGSLFRGSLTARLFLVLPVGSAGFLFLLLVLNSSYSLVAHEVITSTAANAPR
jgi:hypothetical protein